MLSLFHPGFYLRKSLAREIITIIIFLFIGLFFPANISASVKIAGSSAKLADAKNNQTGFESELVKTMVIKRVFSQYRSPLVEVADSFVNACHKYDLDCFLLPAIAGVESTFGRFVYPNSYNPFGWGGGYIVFKNWQESVEVVAKNLREDYLNKGAEDLYRIGKIYAPFSPVWAKKVDFFMKKFYNEEAKITDFKTD